MKYLSRKTKSILISETNWPSTSLGNLITRDSLNYGVLIKSKVN